MVNPTLAHKVAEGPTLVEILRGTRIVNVAPNVRRELIPHGLPRHLGARRRTNGLNRADELARHNRVLGRGTGVGVRRRMHEVSFHSGRAVALPSNGDGDGLPNERRVDANAGRLTLRPQLANQFCETDGVEKH